MKAIFSVTSAIVQMSLTAKLLFSKEIDALTERNLKDYY